MDQFVRDQLTLADCAHLIPLFRDKGFDEAAFRKLTMPKLAYLLPDDKKYRLVLSIWSIIMCLDPAPVSSSSTGILPPPDVIVKTEPLEYEAEPTPQDDDDEDLMVNDKDKIGSPPLENEAELFTAQDDDDEDLMANDTIGSPPLENEAEHYTAQDDDDEDQMVNDTIQQAPSLKPLEHEAEAEQTTPQEDDDEVELAAELERIDEFVKYQLTSIGCESLIELFKGYNEERYRKLNNKKLMQLLPEDEDGGLALKIMDSIRWLNTPDHDRSTHPGLPFPPPTVIVNVTTQNPSAFTVGEIQQELQERSEQINENCEKNENAHQSSSSSPPSISDSHSTRNEAVNTGGPLADNTLAEAAEGEIPEGNGENAATTDAAHDNGRSDNDNTRHARLNCGSRKRRGDTVTSDVAESQPKEKRSKEEERSWRKFLQCTFSQTSSRLSRSKLKERFGDKLEFDLSATIQLDDVLRLIETYSGHLCHFVKRLKLTIPAVDDDVISISNQHLHRLANLPEAFLNQLTELTFNLKFPESTDFRLITTLLSRCPSLTVFKMQRGTVLTGDEAVSFHVPKMDKLESFTCAASIRLSVPDYDQPPRPVDATVVADTCTTKGNFFRVDFSNLTFPALGILQVGPLIELKFENLSQFPKMKFFDVGFVSSIKPWFSTDATCDNATWISLCGVARIELIKQIPQAFPNLTELRLTLPAVSTLRSVITNMKNMHIERFAATVNFEFEAAFLTAFCGHPFNLVTENDKRKFDQLQKYKHWKGLMKHLGIEVPTDELSNASLSEEDFSNNSSATVVNEPTTISSFKFLKSFKLRHIMANIYLPEDDTHWSNPDVQLSFSRWSSVEQRFPSTILLDELSKLKGQLQLANLQNFELDQDTIVQFQEIMGFQLNFDPWYSTRILNVDTVSSTDLSAINMEN